MVKRVWACWLGVKTLRGAKFAQKISPTALHNHQKPDPFIQGRMDPCFYVRF